MPIGVTRVSGDSQLVNNVGDGYTKNANAQVINTGIASPIKAYKITTLGITANLANELKGPSGAGLTGAVDTLLKTVASNASILAYQVDAAGSTAQLSVIVERSGWGSDADLQTAIRTLSHDGTAGANIGAYGNVFPALAAVTSTGGIKIA
jgi:hypothetical protein